MILVVKCYFMEKNNFNMISDIDRRRQGSANAQKTCEYFCE